MSPNSEFLRRGSIEVLPATRSASGLMTEADLAKYLQLSHQTLRNWRVQGVGPKFVRISGRAIRYRMDDVLGWIECRLASSTSDT